MAWPLMEPMCDPLDFRWPGTLTHTLSEKADLYRSEYANFYYTIFNATCFYILAKCNIWDHFLVPVKMFVVVFSSMLEGNRILPTYKIFR